MADSSNDANHIKNTWSMLISSIESDDVKHVADSYHLQIPNSWIFNVENQFIRKVDIGNRIICELPDWWEKVNAVEKSVYLYTGFLEWILLDDRETYDVEVEGVRRKVWIGKIRYFEHVNENENLQNFTEV